MVLNNILPLIPDHSGYLEGCLGGGSVFFGKRKSDIEILNDLNDNVYSLFKVISDAELFKIFLERVELTLYHDSIRKNAKENLKTELSILDRAYFYFIFNRMSFQGTGGFAKHHNQVRKNLSKSVSDYLSTVKNLPEIFSRLKEAIILKEDVIDLIPKYDIKGWFYYLDPPYHHSTRTSTRYETDMSDDLHKKFLDSISKIKNAKCLISGYDCTAYDALEENGFKKITFHSNNNKTINSSEGTSFVSSTSIETLWMNYEVGERDLFQ